MRALIIKVVLSSEGPYGFSFFCICKNTLLKGERNMGSLCSGLKNCHALHMSAKSRVQWFFHSPEDHFSSSPHTELRFTRRCNILLIRTLNICMQNREKKIKQWTVSFAGGGKHLCIMHNFFRGLKYVWEQGFGINLSHSCRQMNANDFSRTILPGEQI